MIGRTVGKLGRSERFLAPALRLPLFKLLKNISPVF